MKNKGFNLLTVVVIMCLVAVISAITVGVIITNSYKSADGTPYSELIKDENIQEFLDVYSSVTSDYYEDINKKEMIESAMDGMLDYLGDNYTTYMTPEAREALAERLKGTYRGIGITIENCTIKVVNPGSPAEKAGLLPEDVIIKAEGEDFTTCDSDKVVSLIKDNDKVSVNIVVKRGEEEKSFDIKPSEIIISALNYGMIEDTNIGYISISIFSSNVADQFKTAMNTLKEKGMEKLIIDVRDNTGGYLDGAKDIASQLLYKGKLIYSLKDKKETTGVYDTTDEHFTGSIVVLINENSASSSEILAAALKDSYNATLVGTKSYGKGKVQQTFTLEDGSMAKYTTALWLRPNGNCIDGVGLMPDITVSKTTTTDDAGNQVEIDTPLNHAVETLKAN